MPNMRRATTAAFILVLSLAFGSVQSFASAFAAWKVVDLKFGDVLNLRKYPASTSQMQAAYPVGTVLQMTGKCTGGVNLLDIAGQPAWKQIKAARYVWCQVWHDPARDGKFTTGWVYGRYIAPLGGVAHGRGALTRSVRAGLSSPSRAFKAGRTMNPSETRTEC